MAPGMQYIVAIASWVSAPEIRDFAVPFDVTSFYVRFLGSSIRLQPTPLNGFFTKNTSNDIVPGKEVPFGGLDDYILYL